MSDKADGQRRLKLCLAASGGGHLRQLFDLEPAWKDHDCFFVSERSVLAEGLSQNHRTHFVAHYAFGQLKIANPLAVLGNMVLNFWQSLRIVLKERPDMVVTTGAAAVFWTCLLARYMGARLVVIESFARFEAPSVFGRLTRRIASDRIVQSEALKRTWSDAHLFDPFKLLDGNPPPKKALTFATVGATLPFDRLTEAVFAAREAGAISGELLVQVGKSQKDWSKLAGKGVTVVETLPFDKVQDLLRDAEMVIGHGGTGSIITALRQGCKVVAMPRRHDLGEVYDDHQVEIVEAFEKRGLVSMVMDAKDLDQALQLARSRKPVMATTQPDALIGWLEKATREELIFRSL
jgi:UDP-N-acetylglucosamine--N-acetylmuramyl-(pentapeptide) pyrophosphoryl-undecaprenol N-acetylglucosamine transferase